MRVQLKIIIIVMVTVGYMYSSPSSFSRCYDTTGPSSHEIDRQLIEGCGERWHLRAAAHSSRNGLFAGGYFIEDDHCWAIRLFKEELGKLRVLHEYRFTIMPMRTRRGLIHGKLHNITVTDDGDLLMSYLYTYVDHDGELVSWTKLVRYDRVSDRETTMLWIDSCIEAMMFDQHLWFVVRYADHCVLCKDFDYCAQCPLSEKVIELQYQASTRECLLTRADGALIKLPV